MGVNVSVGVAVSVSVGVGVHVKVAVGEGISVGVSVGTGEGVSVGSSVATGWVGASVGGAEVGAGVEQAASITMIKINVQMVKSFRGNCINNPPGDRVAPIIAVPQKFRERADFYRMPAGAFSPTPKITTPPPDRTPYPQNRMTGRARGIGNILR